MEVSRLRSLEHLIIYSFLDIVDLRKIRLISHAQRRLLQDSYIVREAKRGRGILRIPIPADLDGGHRDCYLCLADQDRRNYSRKKLIEEVALHTRLTIYMTLMPFSYGCNRHS